MSDNLTDSQRKLLAAMRREMVEVTQPILDEIARLRAEQTARHEEGVKRKKDARRHVLGLFKALFGDDD